MSDLRKLAGSLSAEAAQENCDSYEYDLMQEASVSLRQAADLIEQLQQRVGELEGENQALAAHVDNLREAPSKSMSGHRRHKIRWSEWDYEISDVALGALKREHQTSLAEVRAKQAEESFRDGVAFADGDTEWLEDLEDAIREHANKIRNGDTK